MKVKLFLFLLLVLISGCGHNSVVQSKGWGIDISWSQDSYVPNLRIGYWDNSFAIVKENVEVELSSDTGIDASTGSESSSVDINKNTNAGNTSNNASNNASTEKINKKVPGINASTGATTGNRMKMKVGQQTNGYVRDVLTSPNLSKESVDLSKQIYK